MKRNGEARIYESLQEVLSRSGERQRVPVLIMLESHEDSFELERVLGPVQIKFRYRVVPAVAATVTRAQVAVLARQPWVRHIELDGEVRTMMEGASRWFGAAQARADYGVTGDRDGSPSYSRADIVIAVIDTGIDAGHVDLAGGKVIGWRDWVGSREQPYDDHGHGTHVAGVAAGAGAGNAAYTGVAPGAALVGLKVLDRNGSGSLSNVAAAVDWAVENRVAYGIRIISMSLTQWP